MAINIRVGRNLFVNQNCTFYDLGGLDIADDVLIGPNVSLINDSLEEYTQLQVSNVAL